MGVVRLLVVLSVATGAAVLLDHFTGRSAAFGFYVVGAFILAAAFLMSGADMGSPYYYDQGEREQRVSLSFSYVVAGLLVLAVAVAVDALYG